MNPGMMETDPTPSAAPTATHLLSGASTRSITCSGAKYRATAMSTNITMNDGAILVKRLSAMRSAWSVFARLANSERTTSTAVNT